MEITKINANNAQIAQIISDEIIIKDEQSAVDLIATVMYAEGVNNIIINKSSIIEDFFNLKTSIAGGILQKFINYQMRLAIVGDFSIYSSKSLKDFIYESNKGDNIYFVDTVEQAIQKLSGK